MQMKIAVTAQDGSLDAMVDPRFGRATCFFVVDTKTMEFAVVDNKQNIHATFGAGVQAGQIVAKHGVEAVLTGNCGPNAFKTLNMAEIKVYTEASGTVREAVEAFKNGDLALSESANVEANSGL